MGSSTMAAHLRCFLPRCTPSIESGGRGCQLSVQSVLAVARDRAVFVRLRDPRTTDFQAGEVRTDALQGRNGVAEWLLGCEAVVVA